VEAYAAVAGGQKWEGIEPGTIAAASKDRRQSRMQRSRTNEEQREAAGGGVRELGRCWRGVRTSPVVFRGRAWQAVGVFIGDAQWTKESAAAALGECRKQDAEAAVSQSKQKSRGGQATKKKDGHQEEREVALGRMGDGAKVICDLACFNYQSSRRHPWLTVRASMASHPVQYTRRTQAAQKGVAGVFLAQRIPKRAAQAALGSK
jgi:hypothetical protein